MKKSELRQMIREMLKEELSRTKQLMESDNAKATKTEADYDNVMKQIKADLISEINPTPTVELEDEFFGDFKDINISWDLWNLGFEYEEGDNPDFERAYDSVVKWVNKNANRYAGFRLNFLDSLDDTYYEPFITINVYGN